MNEPLVSIVIPAYKPDFFKACLDSALCQTYTKFEVIVSDDCPTKAIADIVNGYHDHRIRYVRNIPANGPALNYVESFKLAKGKLIKFLNDDDLLHPDCLTKMVPYLEDKNIKVVTSYRQEIDGDGQLLPDRLHNLPLFLDTVYIDGKSLAVATLGHRLNFIGEPSCFLFRKQDVLHIKPHLLCFEGYGYEKSGLGDVGLQLNLLKQGDCVYIGQHPLSSIRIFAGQWQGQSGVRSWSIKSWKQFTKRAKLAGLFDLYSSKYILYRIDKGKPLKRKSLVSYRYVRHQLAWLYKNAFRSDW